MTDFTSKKWTYFLTETAESMINFATFPITMVEPVTERMRNITELPAADHLHDLMTSEEEAVVDDVNFVMSAVIGPIVCILGMLGNLISIITWNRPGMRSSTGRYLSGQAIANFIVLLTFLLSDSIQYWSPNMKFSPIYGAFFSYFGFPMFHFGFIFSVWVTVGVTMDRYLMVCCITKAKKLCSESRATFSLLLIAINGFLINLPHFAFFSPVYPDTIRIIDTDSHTDNHNVNVTELEGAYALTDFGMSSAGQFYEFWTHCMVLILVPWVSIFFMNVMIIAKISKANKRMADKKTAQSMKASRESENQITRLLLCATFAFLFFLGLQCISQCLCVKQPPGINIMMATASFAFGKTGILFHASMNFLLYCLTGRRFRMELLKMIGLDKKFKSESSLMGNSSSNASTNITTASTDTIANDI